MQQHTPFFELQEAFAVGGCAFCTLTSHTLERFFSGLVYEAVNDTTLRAAIRRTYGFCAAHGTMLVAARSALGIAIVQRDVLRAATSALAASQARPGWRANLFGARVAELFPAQGPCPACQLADETAAQWAQLLVQQYAELRAAFQGSAGLCLDHLRLAHDRSSAAVHDALRDDQLAIWARLEAELDSFIDGHDYQLAAAPVGAERDAWARATTLLAGDWRVAGSLRKRAGDG